MAVDVTIVGNGMYAGAKSAIQSYSVSEESTPVEASDTTGGTGQITFNAIDDPSRLGSILLLNDTVKLSDGDRGDTEGKINAINGQDGLLSVTADSRLGRLVVDKTADPVNGTFNQAMNYYLGLAGLTTGIAIDASLSNISVIAPGWTGDLWTRIKQLCVYAGAEISLVKGNIVVRPVRQRRAMEINNISQSWNVSNIDLAQSVEVFYYNSEYKTNRLVYPKGGWNQDVTVYTIDAGQTLTVNIPVDITLVSLQQPIVQTSVAKDYSGPTSVYAVAGNDGLPIQASQWIASGGYVNVAIGADRKSIDLTAYGPTGDVARYAPYRIAMSAGPSDYYSSLRIIGTGMHYNKQSVVVPTGVDPATTAREVGVSVDNTFVVSEAQARNLALDVACKWAAPERTINITKSTINKPSETSQNLDYASFADFDALYAGKTFAQFDTSNAGQTFAQFDNYWYALVQNNFDYQVFGNANGARVQWRRAVYRIRNATISESEVSYTAEADTTFGDFDASATGMTFAQFDTMYANLTFDDFALIPLANVKPEYDRG